MTVGDGSVCKATWLYFQQPLNWPELCRAAPAVGKCGLTINCFCFHWSLFRQFPGTSLTLQSLLVLKPPASRFLTWQGNLDVAKPFPRLLAFTQFLDANPCHHKQASEGRRCGCHVSFRGDCGTAVVKNCFCFHILWPRRGPHREREGGVRKGGSPWLDLRAP